MLTLTKPLTVDEFWDYVLQHPLEAGHYELSQGAIDMAGGTGIQHGGIVFRLTGFLFAHIESHQLALGTGAETCYVLSAEQAIVRCPDVAFIRAERVPKPIPERFAPLAPDFAAEVKSPSDNLRKLRHKCEEYLTYGVRLVWLVLPETELVEVYQPEQDIFIAKGDDLLLGYEVLPGFSLPAQAIFPR